MTNIALYHCFNIALGLIAAFILMTANQLGPVEVFLVPLGLYLFIFAVTAEVVLFAGYYAHHLINAISRAATEIRKIRL